MKNIKVLLGLIGFVAFLGSSYFGYNFLNSKYNITRKTEVTNDNASYTLENKTNTLVEDFLVYDETTKCHPLMNCQINMAKMKS